MPHNTGSVGEGQELGANTGVMASACSRTVRLLQISIFCGAKTDQSGTSPSGPVCHLPGTLPPTAGFLASFLGLSTGRVFSKHLDASQCGKVHAGSWRSYWRQQQMPGSGKFQIRISMPVEFRPAEKWRLSRQREEKDP